MGTYTVKMEVTLEVNADNEAHAKHRALDFIDCPGSVVIETNKIADGPKQNELWLVI